MLKGCQKHPFFCNIYATIELVIHKAEDLYCTFAHRSFKILGLTLALTAIVRAK